MAVHARPLRVGFAALLREAHDLSKGSRTTTALVYFAFVGVMLLVGSTQRWLSGVGPDPRPVPDPSDPALLLNGLLPLAVVAVFAPALCAIGLERAAGRPVGFPGIMRHARHAPQFFLLGAIGLLAQFFLLQRLGWPLGGLLGALLQVLSLFAAFHIVDRGSNALAALTASARLAMANAGLIVLALLLLGAFRAAAALLAGMPFVLDLGALAPVVVAAVVVWFLPIGLILTALIYRQTQAHEPARAI